MTYHYARQLQLMILMILMMLQTVKKCKNLMEIRQHFYLKLQEVQFLKVCLHFNK